MSRGIFNTVGSSDDYQISADHFARTPAGVRCLAKGHLARRALHRSDRIGDRRLLRMATGTRKRCGARGRRGSRRRPANVSLVVVTFSAVITLYLKIVEMNQMLTELARRLALSEPNIRRTAQSLNRLRSLVSGVHDHIARANLPVEDRVGPPRMEDRGEERGERLPARVDADYCAVRNRRHSVFDT